MGFFDLFRGQKPEDANKRYRQGGYGATELFLEAYSGDADGVARLLAQGTDPNERSFVNFPDSEIIASARKGSALAARGYTSSQVSELIWGKGAPVQALTLMMQAFRERQNNPNAYYHTELGYSALIFPVLHGDAHVVKLLVDAGASPNAVQLDGTFPLYVASVVGNLAIVKALLAAGAEIDRKTPYGVTALRAAIDAQHFDIAVHLIVKGASLNTWADDGLSILGAAISKAEWSLAGMIFFHSSMCEDEEEPLFSTDSEIDSYFWNNFAMPMGFIESDDFLESFEGVDTGELSKKLVATSAAGGAKRSQPDHYMRSVNLELLAACSGSYGNEVERMMHGIPAVHDASLSDEPFLLFFVTRRIVHRGPEDSAIADFFHQLIRNYYLARAIDEGDDQMFEACLAGGADPNQACHYGRTRFPPIVLASVLRRKRLCERLVEAGANINRCTIELCEEAVGLGGKNNPLFFLARVMEDVDSEQSKELYQACVDRGDVYGAARSLAMLVETKEPDRATELYELSIAAGNALSARDLAFLYRDSDPDKAKGLFEKAIELGDEDESSLQLALMVMDDDPERARELLVRSFRAGNRLSAPYWLASLLEKDNPEEAVTYYCIAADAGDPYACERLAWLIHQTDRVSAIKLCERAIESGESTGAEYLLAFMLKGEDPERSIELYECCLREGTFTSLASFELAGLIESSDPMRAAELYELSISEGFRPAYAKLARLVGKGDKDRAVELCEHAVELGDVCDAPFFLAWLVEEEDPERAKLLYQICIDNGYSDGAANNLANLIKSTDPDRARSLFEQSIEAGNLYYATANLADMLTSSDPERAAELYQISIDAGNVESCAKLARLVADSDRNRAIMLCEQAVEKGDAFDGPFFLAWLLEPEDPERSKALYQKCVDNGNRFNAANNLAHLIKNDEPDRAIALFEMSMAEGNTYYAAKNLADMLRENNARRAMELYQLAIDAGNVSAYSELARLISDSDRCHAVELCEQAVELGDVGDAPFFLAWLLSDEDLERSKELYQLCVDNGYWYGAAYNLAALVMDDDPARAIELFRKAADAGRTDAYNNAGVLAMKRSAALAADLFNKAIAAGDKLFAPCNLAHMLMRDDVGRAEELYKLALDNEVAEEATEALIGLYLLFEHRDPVVAQSYLAQAKHRSNLRSSVEFMVDYYNAADTELAQRVRSVADEEQPSIGL